MKTAGLRSRRGGGARQVEPSPIVMLLLFEAADCLMALPASEVGRLLASEPQAVTASEVHASGEGIDLGEYFTGCRSQGPWLRWGRGELSAWLRVARVIEVLPCAIGALAPMPARLRAERRAGAFWAAGVRGDEVFLLLDPAKLGVPNAAAALEVQLVGGREG